LPPCPKAIEAGLANLFDRIPCSVGDSAYLSEQNRLESSGNKVPQRSAVLPCRCTWPGCCGSPPGPPPPFVHGSIQMKRIPRASTNSGF